MKYHGYICYNSKELNVVESFFELLTNSTLKLFFDKNEKAPGQSTTKIVEGLQDSQHFIVVIGESEYSQTWQDFEVDLFLSIYHMKDKKKRNIFVLLLADINEEKIPIKLRGFERYYYSIDNYDKEKIFMLSQQLQEHYTNFDNIYSNRPILKESFKILQKHTINWYNENAELYYDTWHDLIPEGNIINFIKEVKNNFKGVPFILDAGCGPGHHSLYLTKEGMNVVGLDLADKAIEIAKRTNNRNATFEVGDFRNLEPIFKFNKDIFDGIWASGSVVHVNRESLGAQLRQYFAHLKPKGILGISFQIGFQSEIKEDGRFFERYARENIIRKKIEEIGFTILNENIEYTNLGTIHKKIKTWVYFTLQAPNEKQKLNIEFQPIKL